MFKRINWLSFIPIFLALLLVGVLINELLVFGVTDIQTRRVIDFITSTVSVIVSFFIARSISRAIYDKLERRRYFKEHPEEDRRDRNS